MKRASTMKTWSPFLSTTLYASIEKHIDIPEYDVNDQYEDADDELIVDPDETQIEEDRRMAFISKEERRSNTPLLNPLNDALYESEYPPEETHLSPVIDLKTPIFQQRIQPPLKDFGKEIVEEQEEEQATISPSQETNFSTGKEGLQLQTQPSSPVIEITKNPSVELIRQGSIIIVVDDDESDEESQLRFMNRYLSPNRITTPIAPKPLEYVLPPTVPLQPIQKPLISSTIIREKINDTGGSICEIETCDLEDEFPNPKANRSSTLPTNLKTELLKTESIDEDDEHEEKRNGKSLKRSFSSISNVSSSLSGTLKKQHSTQLKDEDDWMSFSKLRGKNRRLKQLTLVHVPKN